MVCCLLSVVYVLWYVVFVLLSIVCCLCFDDGLLSIVCCPWSVIHGLLSMVCCQGSVVIGLLSMVCCLRSPVTNISAGERTASRPRLTSHDTPTGGRILDLPRSRLQGVVTRLHGTGQLPGKGNLVWNMYMAIASIINTLHSSGPDIILYLILLYPKADRVNQQSGTQWFHWT